MAIRLETRPDIDQPVQMTAAEYISAPQSAEKSQLIEGVFMMSSPASFEHERVLVFLSTLFNLFVEKHDLGTVLGANTAYRLSDSNVYQPDISFIAREHMARAGTVYVDGPPDLAVEIISPSSRQYDTVDKRLNYGPFGVREYWLIDPIEEAITVYELLQGHLAVVHHPDDHIESRVLQGFWLSTAWLFPPIGLSRPGVWDIIRTWDLA